MNGLPKRGSGEEASIPDGLSWLEAQAEGRRWLAQLPGLVAECAELWSLDVGEPFADSYVSWVAPVVTHCGEPAVLKVQFADRESEHEAAALAAWAGDGAVLLLDRDPRRHALLLERCVPGTHLSTLPASEAEAVLIELLPRLWIAPPPEVGGVAAEAAWWASGLAARWERSGRPFEEDLLVAALRLLERLPSTQGELVLTHQDLHADNVLSAHREPWLVIDPKPLAAERAFSLAPIIRADELGHSHTGVIGRLDRLSGALGVDRERARGWALAQTIAWAFEGDVVLPRHVQTARWLYEA